MDKNVMAEISARSPVFLLWSFVHLDPRSLAPTGLALTAMASDSDKE